MLIHVLPQSGKAICRVCKAVLLPSYFNLPSPHFAGQQNCKLSPFSINFAPKENFIGAKYSIDYVLSVFEKVHCHQTLNLQKFGKTYSLRTTIYVQKRELRNIKKQRPTTKNMSQTGFLMIIWKPSNPDPPIPSKACASPSRVIRPSPPLTPVNPRAESVRSIH